MKSTTRKLANKVIAIATLFCMTTQGTFAAFLNLSQKPLFIAGTIPPQVMLTISKDQQLYKKAYNDYSDLDGDGQLETTYSHGIDYYGYFDSYKCYVYTSNVFRPVSEGNRDPLKPANDPVNLAAKYCNAGSPATPEQWSGNFLNWVSMSRIDTVRKLLYGGMRSTDGVPDAAGVSVTVLERTYLPTDAHAWAKYYNGTDIAQLAPFKPATTTTTFSADTAQIRTYCPVDAYEDTSGKHPAATLPSQAMPFVFPPLALEACPSPNPGIVIDRATASKSVSETTPAPKNGQVSRGDIEVMFKTAMDTAMAVGDQIRLEEASDESGASFVSRGNSTADCSGTKSPCLIGTLVDIFNSGRTLKLRVHATGIVPPDTAMAGNANSLHVTNLSRTGISFCNLTPGAANGDARYSHTNRNAPLIRVARGNFELWGASEKLQCMWADEDRPDYAPTGNPAQKILKASDAQGTSGTRSNGNQLVFSGSSASAENPTRASHSLGTGSAPGEFVARVEACVSPLFGTERCKRYTKGNYKPIGLLQEYGDVNLIHFGLMTGSYKKNVSGGVLRKNIGSFNDEVNHDTDGTFKTSAVPPGAPRGAGSAPTPEGIVNTLNYLRIWGYDYFDSGYRPKDGKDADNCAAELTNVVENNCTSWGNPMSEIFFETLRYFAGKTPVKAFEVTSGEDSKDKQLGLPLPEWKDNLSAANFCAPLNTVVFNASVSTNDDDLRDISAADILSSDSAAALTTAVGSDKNEDINGKLFFTGKIVGDPNIVKGVTPSGNAEFELCTAKNIPGLGQVSGICPEGASVAGSYLLAGLAHHAHTNRIRKDIPIPSSDKRSFKVTTYGIQLSTNVPQLVIPVPGTKDPKTGKEQTVVIQPIYRLEIPANGPRPFDCKDPVRCFGGGSLVDLKFVRPIGPDPEKPEDPKRSYGKVYIVWEDSEQGGDYDQDMAGTLEWRVDATAGTITVTTHALTSSTLNPQGFGFSISGTDKDGPHFFSGIAGLSAFGFAADTSHLPFNFEDPTKATGTYKLNGKDTVTTGCINCRASDDPTGPGPTERKNPKRDPFNPDGLLNFPSKSDDIQKGPVSVTFKLGTSTAGTLKDPLWYAAKYGGFVDNNDNQRPDTAAEWDSRNDKGQQGSDGIPDTYFLVTNPLGLVSALDRAFVAILSNASASSVATNSTSLQTGSTIYQARFNSNDWSGQVLAFTVSAGNAATGEQAGTISQIPDWDAGHIVNFQDPTDATTPPAATTPSKSESAIRGAGRTILTYNDSATSRRGVPFRWPASLSTKPTATELAALTPTDISQRLVKALNFAPAPPKETPEEDFRGLKRLEFLRGSQKDETVGATSFRARPTSRLGDIVNSNPNFVGAPNSGFGEASYAAFRQQNIGRKPVVYVGGNDGMLHGFRAEDGREILAYVPSMVHDRLNRLTSKTYIGINSGEHRYFVDGSPEISDALIRTGTTSEWRTVLVGGLGAGGQGVFALNITKPQDFAESKASDIVMWEFSDKDDRDMGYVLAQPTIRRMAAKDANGNNRWAAIVPAGYNNSEPQPGEAASTVSTTGSAYIFLIFLDGPTGPGGTWRLGTDYIKLRGRITTGSDRDDPASPNGLTQPLAADVNADGVVDYIYAGDLRGNLWKFDVTATDSSTWSNRINRVVLFTATDPAGTPQPITAKPEATLHPDGTGFIITFGTGKYLEPTDPHNPPGTPVPPAKKVPYQVQSFYGIWDRNDAKPIAEAALAGASVPLQTVVASRDLLLGHEIKSDTTGSFRVVVPFAKQPDRPNWFKKFAPPIPIASDPINAEHMGWYLDFPDAGTTGERSVFRPILTSGRLIFTTLLPLTEACEFGGTSFIMVIDPTTGGRIDGAVLDVKADQQLNSEDKVSYTGGTTNVFASGAKSTIGITPTPTIIRAEGAAADTGGAASKILGTSGPLVAASGVLLAYALAAGSSGGNASTMIGLSAAGGRVSWRELMAD